MIGVPDAYRGETVKAFVVLQPGTSATADEIMAFCRERLAAYKVPRLVVFRDSLPKSGVGKYLRRALRRSVGAQRAASFCRKHCRKHGLHPCLRVLHDGRKLTETNGPTMNTRHRTEPQIPATRTLLHRQWPLLGICLFGLVLAASAADQVTLADHGKSKYRIVLPASAIPAERYAAEELQRYLEKMSGAKLPIVTDAEKPTAREIQLGNNAHLARLRSKVDFTGLGPDGFVLRVDGNTRDHRRRQAARHAERRLYAAGRKARRALVHAGTRSRAQARPRTAAQTDGNASPRAGKPRRLLARNDAQRGFRRPPPPQRAALRPDGKARRRLHRLSSLRPQLRCA